MNHLLAIALLVFFISTEALYILYPTTNERLLERCRSALSKTLQDVNDEIDRQATFTFNESDNSVIKQLKPVLTVSLSSITDFWTGSKESLECGHNTTDASNSPLFAEADLVLGTLFIETNLTVKTPRKLAHLRSVAVGNYSVHFLMAISETTVSTSIREGNEVLCRSDFVWSDSGPHFYHIREQSEMWTDKVISKQLVRKLVPAKQHVQPTPD